MARRARIGAQVWAFGLISLTLGVTAFAAGPEPEDFPEYQPAHTVIKCPYIPKDIEQVPECGGKKATCLGTAGNDLVLGHEGQDVVAALAGNDVVHGDAGNDIVCGGAGTDSLMGARGDDTMFGNEGSDWLFGAPGADQLAGGPGNFDVLWGGPGVDELDGGAGRDDVCMLQREMGNATKACETIYPPPGYVHEDEPEPGVLKLGK